jgi:hypothetical protein
MNNREQLVLAIANYEKNKEWIEDIPHEKIEDLAVYVKLRFNCHVTGMEVRKTLTMQDLAYLQMSKEEALMAAKKNATENAKIERMEDFIASLKKEALDFSIPPILVLSSGETDGAAVIACPEILQAVHTMIGEDFYILPSSIHEVLIVPKYICDDAEELKEMVRTVNQAEVMPEERLSDNVYTFDGLRLKLT